jgi:hypothetical protein
VGLFFTVPLVFIVVIITPAPNYFADIQYGLKDIPQCAPRLDAAVASLVADFLGVGMGTFLASQMFLILVIAVPSMMHGCYFITWREVRDLINLNIFERRCVHAGGRAGGQG